MIGWLATKGTSANLAGFVASYLAIAKGVAATEFASRPDHIIVLWQKISRTEDLRPDWSATGPPPRRIIKGLPLAIPELRAMRGAWLRKAHRSDEITAKRKPNGRLWQAGVNAGVPRNGQVLAPARPCAFALCLAAPIVRIISKMFHAETLR